MSQSIGGASSVGAIAGSYASGRLLTDRTARLCSDSLSDLSEEASSESVRVGSKLDAGALLSNSKAR